MRIQCCLVALGVAAALSGCGGGGSSGSTSGGGGGGGGAQQSVSGIWQGSNPEQGVAESTIALVSPTGQYFAADINEANECEIVVTGNVSVTGSNYSGSTEAATVQFSTASDVATGCIYADGSTWAHGTLSGTVTTGTSLTFTNNLTTSGGLALSALTGTLTFSALYNESSSLSKITGNWLEPTGDVQSIHSDGTFTEQDAQSGCVINGQYSIIDATVNIYGGSATYANCTGVAAVLNGQTGTGLFTLNDQTSPAELVGGFAVTLSNGSVIAAVGTLTQN